MLWRRTAIFTIVLIVGACSVITGSKPTELAIDFVGLLEDAETELWQVNRSGGGRGGPESEYRVGPGKLILSNGQEISVPFNTPGGTLCSQLPGSNSIATDCVIMGAFVPGTTSAAWFATRENQSELDPPAYSIGLLKELKDLSAVVSTGLGLLTLPVSEQLQFSCLESGAIIDGEVQLPPTAGHVVAVNEDLKIVEIICLYGH